VRKKEGVHERRSFRRHNRRRFAARGRKSRVEGARRGGADGSPSTPESGSGQPTILSGEKRSREKRCKGRGEKEEDYVILKREGIKGNGRTKIV